MYHEKSIRESVVSIYFKWIYMKKKLGWDYYLLLSLFSSTIRSTYIDIFEIIEILVHILFVVLFYLSKHLVAPMNRIYFSLDASLLEKITNKA